jgi:transcriptional regulator GlxA family with amidase domain
MYYFCKIFKKETGMGFSEFVARIRVETAKDLIANSALSINAVANHAGFGSVSQLNRVFHRFVSCSPKEYHASLRQAGPTSKPGPLLTH